MKDETVRSVLSFRVFGATNLFLGLQSFPLRLPHFQPRGKPRVRRDTPRHYISAELHDVLINSKRLFLPGPRCPGSWHHQWPDLTEWSHLVLLQPERAQRICLWPCVHPQLLKVSMVTYCESSGFVAAAKQTWGFDHLLESLRGLVFLLATQSSPEISWEWRKHKSHQLRIACRLFDVCWITFCLNQTFS